MPQPGAERTSTASAARAARAVTGRVLLVGTSHHLAPLAVRERLAAVGAWGAGDGTGENAAPSGESGKSAERASESLARAVRARVGPAVVVSTCNRLEVYCWTERPRARERLAGVLARWSGLRRAQLAPYLYARTGEDAARHLIRVAAGLDSLAVGESQVLGQVRAAWQEARQEARPDATQEARQEGALGPELDALFRRGIEAARRIRRLGGFDRHPSVAGLAVEAVAHALGGMEGRYVAVLGAGVTGQEAVARLLDSGAARVTLLNRSRRRLASLRRELPGERVAFQTLDGLPAALAEADALICATSATAPVVTAAAVREALTVRGTGGEGATGTGTRPLVMVDIAVPRDVEGEVRALPGVRLVDLDDMAAHCAADAPARQDAMERADALAREAAAAYAESLRLRTAAKEITALRAHAAAIRSSELRRVRGRLAGLTARELAVVEQLTHSIVQKLLHPPTVALRRAAGSGAAARRAREAVIQTLMDRSTRRNAASGGHSRDSGHSKHSGDTGDE